MSATHVVMAGDATLAAPTGGLERPPSAPILHPSIPLRFTDVIDELRTIASMAARTRHVEGASVAAACRRAESLLLVLRRQFMDDVVGPDSPVPLRAQT